MLSTRIKTDSSLLNSTISVKKLVNHIKENDFNFISVSNENVMFDVLTIYNTAKKESLNPIIGVEFNIHAHKDIAFKKINDYKIILIAQTYDGYKNLMYLSTIAHEKGYFKKPRINIEELHESINGLIVVDPHKDGFYFNSEKEDLNIYEKILKHKEFYIGVDENEQITKENRKNIEIKTVISQEYNHLSGEIEFVKILKTIGDDRRELYDANAYDITDSNRLKNKNEIDNFFDSSTIQNTINVFKKCNIEIPLGNATPPSFIDTKKYAKQFNLKDEKDSTLFEFLCRRNLEEKIVNFNDDLKKEYRDRLEYEIKVINDMNFPGYMLIVWDFIKEAKKLKIAVGPGRGSAAGSLVAFALEITSIDPIKHGLLFERFLNPERVSMPDIDIDFMQARRSEIISYVIEKYGHDNVAQVATFSTLLPKGVVKDVAKTLGYVYGEVDKITKTIPDDVKNITEAINESKELQDFINSKENGEFYKEALLKLEGLKRNRGVHAAGVVISDDKLYKKTPLISSEKDDFSATQYSLDFLEDIDLIKFDFLGLKTLDVIDNAIKLINKLHNKNLTVDDIDIYDPNIYKMISNGDTIGLFQIESTGMIQLNKKLKPDNFEDLTAVLALYRPGPLNSGMVDDFIDCKHGRKEVTYLFDSLKTVLEPTYGVPVYQEQIMSMVQIIGGFSLGKSDIVRRAMGKKKPEIMEKYKQEFVDGAKKQGYEENAARETFDIIAGFAEYGFNKSHSAAYAKVTAITAWLKYYFKTEFMVSLLNSIHDDSDKVSLYAEYCKKTGIDILPPSVNKSYNLFSYENGNIRFGLETIKGVGEKISKNIVKNRKERQFKTIYDFLDRIDLKLLQKDVFERFAASGALDDFSISRRRLLHNSNQILKTATNIQIVKKELKFSLFSENTNYVNIVFEIPHYHENEPIDELEMSALSISLTDSKIDFGNTEEGDINFAIQNNIQNINTNVKILDIHKKMTRNNKIFHFAKVLEKSGEYPGISFDGTLEEYFLDHKKYIFNVDVKIDQTENGPKLLFKNFKPIDIIKQIEEKEICFVYVKDNEDIKKIENNFEDGSIEVVYLVVENKKAKLKYSNKKISEKSMHEIKERLAISNFEKLKKLL